MGDEVSIEEVQKRNRAADTIAITCRRPLFEAQRVALL